MKTGVFIICMGILFLIPFISSSGQLIKPDSLLTEAQVEIYINNSNFSWGDYNISAGWFFGNVSAEEGFFDKLTNIGELIMSGVITSQDIIPITTNLYDLGNSTNWFKELFVKVIHSENITADNIISDYLNSTDIDSENINTDYLNSTDIESKDIDTDDLDSKNVNVSDNLTISGYELREKEDNFVITLT